MFENPGDSKNFPEVPANLPVEDIFEETEGKSESKVPEKQTVTPIKPSFESASKPLATEIYNSKTPIVYSSSKGLITLVTIIIIALIIGGWFFLSSRQNKANTNMASVNTENVDQAAESAANNNVGVNLVPVTPVDTDHDGLIDQEEIQAGTDPNKIDSDGDGLTDYEELRIYKTNPLQPDTDGDGYSDGNEVQQGYNPNGAGKIFAVPTSTLQ